MSTGYLYVLQNKAFGANVVKIGLTTRSPDVRAREIYSGATGVPMPFDIAIAYSVADCKAAEKIAHRRLRPYRLNKRREFFRLQVSVATMVVHEVCHQVNKDLGVLPPSTLEFPVYVDTGLEQSDPVFLQEESQYPVRIVPLARLAVSSINTSHLTSEQKDRAEILLHLLSKLYPVEKNCWLEDFTRDSDPERELKIWEAMAKAYLTLPHADDAPESLRKEAFALLLERTWYPTSKVLEGKQLVHFTVVTAKRLLEAYELRPKPIRYRIEF